MLVHMLSPRWRAAGSCSRQLDTNVTSPFASGSIRSLNRAVFHSNFGLPTSDLLSGDTCGLVRLNAQSSASWVATRGRLFFRATSRSHRLPLFTGHSENALNAVWNAVWVSDHDLGVRLLIKTSARINGFALDEDTL
jgi:hypothetical protein